MDTHLVIALERPPKLTDQPRQDQLSNLRQLRIDNSHQRRKHRRKRQTRRLRLHHAPRKQFPPTDKVLSKQLRHDMFDIRNIDPVDDTGDRLAQRIPRKALILGTRPVRRRRLPQRPQTRRRHVHAAGPARRRQLGKLGLCVEFFDLARLLLLFFPLLLLALQLFLPPLLSRVPKTRRIELECVVIDRRLGLMSRRSMVWADLVEQVRNEGRRRVVLELLV